MEKKITSKELAPILGISQNYVQLLTKKGALSSVKIGMVYYYDSQQAVEEYRSYKEAQKKQHKELRDWKYLTPQKNECRKTILETMYKYLDTLVHNDALADQYDALRSLETPSAEQLARIKELEEVEIPAGIEKEKHEAKIIRTFISVLDVATGWAQHRHLLEMRFLCCIEWKDIAQEVFGAKPDFEARKKQYHMNALSTMHHAVNHIARTLGAEKVHEIINQ